MSWIAVGVAVVTAVAGAAVSISGQKQQAQAAKQAADYNNEVAQNEADKTNKVAAENARRAQKQTRRTLSAIRASNAANGLAMEGTPLAVLGDAQSDLETQIADMAYNASEQSRNFIAQGKMGLWEAKNTATSLKTQQWATGIKAAGSATGSYLSSTGT